jgi:hypothetical protein
MRRLQVPPSARAKRIGKDIPATPLRTPSQPHHHRLGPVHPLGMDMTPFAELPQSTRAAAGGTNIKHTPRKGQKVSYDPPAHTSTVPQTPQSSKKKQSHQQHLQHTVRRSRTKTFVANQGSTPGFTRFHNAFADSPAPLRRSAAATASRSRLSSQLAITGPIPSPPSSPTRHGRVGFRAGVASPLVAEDNNNSAWLDQGGGHRSSDGFLDGGGGEMDAYGVVNEFDENEEDDEEQIGDDADDDEEEEGENEPFLMLPGYRMRVRDARKTNHHCLIAYWEINRVPWGV